MLTIYFQSNARAILDGAEEAFNETRYIEAFALLHAYIDWLMTDLIQLDGCVRDSSKTHELLFHSEYRFRSSAKCLFCKSIINEKQFGELMAFNGLRNKIIHRLVMYSYQCHARNKVTSTEVKKNLKREKN